MGLRVNQYRNQSGSKVTRLPFRNRAANRHPDFGHSKLLGYLLLLCVLLLFCPEDGAQAEEHVDSEAGETIRQFLQKACFDCHNDDLAEGRLNLQQLNWKLNDQRLRQRWILAYDRIAAGEMPPDRKDLSQADRALLLKKLSQSLQAADAAQVALHGRGPLRRLTRDEFEQNLRDLLALPHLDIRDLLPQDREQQHCNKVAEVLDMSRIQLDAYLEAADQTLRQAVASGMQPRTREQHHLPATRMFQSAETFGGREAMFYAKDSQMVPLSGGDLARMRKENRHDPEMELAIFRSASWPYYGYPDVFKAREAGAYRIRFSARAVRQLRDFSLRPAWDSIPMNFRARKQSGADVSGDVRVTRETFDIQPEVGIYETTILLKQSETFEYSLLGLPVPRAINPRNAPLYYDFPPMPEGGHPGVAFQWLEITGPLDSETWPPASHQRLFGELPMRAAEKGTLPIELISTQPVEDAKRLLRRFIQRAERVPTSEDVIQIYERLVTDELEAGTPLAESLLSGYTAFLCSAPFLYLPEPRAGTPQREYAVAARLSHFLGNTRPDDELKRLAEQGQLLSAEILTQQTRRLLLADSAEKFVTNLTDHWLSLKDIRRDEPDSRLYPEYRFDDYLIESMAAETRAFITAMFEENLPVSVLVDADFAFVNDRLARHYGLQPVSGSQMRKVDLPAESPYGGLLTQAAILKVTANGTTTSPVIRGAWIMERVLGNPPPPPPPSVPAVEPDIRGATTIREQLAQHTRDPVCAACHARFDPVGFALEDFDIMGAFRTRYRSLAKGEKVTGIDRAGHDYTYFIAGPTDSRGQLRNGQTFQNIRELKQLLLAEPRQLARNLVQQLIVYATGTPVRFSDRPVVEAILDECGPNGYRTRDLLESVVRSSIFLGREQPPSTCLQTD
ncbi:DUF1588 domain-containing protein [Gimesia sp.]|uniref:DUF1588 domain-containing protein n=1 Tax=Gimesia sp. TaxID=2024833 RepID=UPI003A95A078